MGSIKGGWVGVSGSWVEWGGEGLGGGRWGWVAVGREGVGEVSK